MQTSSTYQPNLNSRPTRLAVNASLRDVDPISVKEAQLRAKIAKLQAQERRQRLIEDLEGPKREPGGFRFIHAFFIVLGLHVAAVGGFFGVSALRKIHASDKLALNEKPPIYAGVPDASPTPTLPSSATSKITSNQDSGQIASKEVKPSSKRFPSLKTKHHSPTEPSAKVRELFAKMHPSASAVNQNATTDVSPAVSALSEIAPAITPSSPKIHKVQPGESLAGIAKANGIKTSTLREANHLDQSDDLQVGQRLTLPAPEARPPLQLVDKAPESLEPKGEQPEQFVPRPERIAPNGIYMVQKGDNPYMVARKLGVSFTDLMMANNISNPADVTIGMRLKVPGSRLASN